MASEPCSHPGCEAEKKLEVCVSCQSRFCTEHRGSEAKTYWHKGHTGVQRGYACNTCIEKNDVCLTCQYVEFEPADPDTAADSPDLHRVPVRAKPAAAGGPDAQEETLSVRTDAEPQASVPETAETDSEVAARD